MKDLEIKRDVVKNQFDKLYRRYKWLLHCASVNPTIEAFDKVIDIEKKLAPLKDNQEIERVCRNLNKSREYRMKNVRKFISQNVISQIDLQAQNLAYFATFTFKPKVLDNTTEDARRQRIRRLIKKYAINGVCNIDFGKTTEREHYHAVLLMSKSNAIEMQKKAEKNGFVNLQIIRTTDNDITRLTKYINKLSYHALKDCEKHLDGSYRCFYYKSFAK